MAVPVYPLRPSRIPAAETGSEVLFYGVWADIQLRGDLLVATALDKQLRAPVDRAE